MAEQDELERLARCMYEEAFSRLNEHRAREVASKITMLYGPPLVRPDVFLVSFQGGGKDSSPSRPTWPKRLLYLDDPYPFGKALRKRFCDADLFETLEKRTVAMAACFPEARSSEAGSWMAKRGPKAEWRAFSTNWVKRMIDATRPRVVLVFGSKASEALGLKNEWRDVEWRCSDSHMVYGRAEVEGFPAVYCHHLSQGASADGVQKCLAEVERLVDAGGNAVDADDPRREVSAARRRPA